MLVVERWLARRGIVKDAPDLEQAILDGTLKLGDADAIHKLPEQKRKEAVEAVKSGKSRTAKRAVRAPHAEARTGETRAAQKPQAPGTSAGQGPSEPSSVSATAVARNGKPWSSVPEEILSPPAVLKDVRLALGTIDLDPRSPGDGAEGSASHRLVWCRRGLKDEFGGRHVRVRAAAKVMCHCMFAVLALTADQLARLVT